MCVGGLLGVDELDLLERAVHPAGEPLLVELLGEGERHGAVAVAMPVSRLVDSQQRHLVIAVVERDDAAVEHAQQVGNLAGGLPLEGDLHLARPGQCLLHRLGDLVIHERVHVHCVPLGVSLLRRLTD